MNKQTRKALATALGLVAAFFLYATMTVPVIAATAPALLTVAFAAAAYFVWPKAPHGSVPPRGSDAG